MSAFFGEGCAQTATLDPAPALRQGAHGHSSNERFIVPGAELRVVRQRVALASGAAASATAGCTRLTTEGVFPRVGFRCADASVAGGGYFNYWRRSPWKGIRRLTVFFDVHLGGALM